MQGSASEGVLRLALALCCIGAIIMTLEAGRVAWLLPVLTGVHAAPAT